MTPEQAKALKPGDRVLYSGNRLELLGVDLRVVQIGDWPDVVVARQGVRARVSQNDLTKHPDEETP